MNNKEYKKLKQNDIIAIQYTKDTPLFALKITSIRINNFMDLFNCVGVIIYHPNELYIGCNHSFNTTRYEDYYILKKVTKSGLIALII